MAISTSFEKHVLPEFNQQVWNSIDDYEAYFLQLIAERGEWNYYTGKDGVERKIDPINHHPQLKEYEVWMEGYSATGESAPCHLAGKAFARNFAQACHIVMCKKYLESIEEENAPENRNYVNPGRWDYDPQRRTYWGCRLQWSKEIASKTFG